MELSHPCSGKMLSIILPIEIEIEIGGGVHQQPIKANFA